MRYITSTEHPGDLQLYTCICVLLYKECLDRIYNAYVRCREKLLFNESTTQSILQLETHALLCCS
jgi:hypothetical protein